MARCLIIGCGCRGLLLADALIARGHAVRGTTREPRRVAEIAGRGAEAVVGDPDRLATLASALEHVSVACVLLGSATGDEVALRELHGPRLEMLLSRLLDTTVRGVVYEAAGTVDRTLLRGGATRVREACSRSRIPFALIEADPAGHDGWVSAAAGAVEDVLEY